jgi:hypothetical protein
MRDELSAVIEVLDTLDAPLDAFVRDDDAGWDDARLLALLDTVSKAGVTIDLAAIPLAVSDPLAAELNLRIDAAPGAIGVHQHGCAHVNHQAEGRQCEFGPARDAQAQQHDLRGGRLLLQHFFGERLQPIFTPPWNRCADHTPALLAGLGFAALSRDRSAAPQQALPELPVDIDWSRRYREGGAAAAAQAIADAVQARAADGTPLGLMLHHAVMAPDELALLGGWLRRLSRHGRLRWKPMAALLRVDA